MRNGELHVMTEAGESMKAIMDRFNNPPADYRPAPLWVWNDAMTKEQIEFQLTEIASHGFGGAFVHPRPGLVTEYLSDEWFDLWGYALEKSKALGIRLYIYDENSYPSGFAGGHVSSICPEALATVMRYQVVDDPIQVKGEIIASFAVEEVNGHFVNAQNLCSMPKAAWEQHDSKFIVLTYEKTDTDGWMAGYAYVDLLRPQVHEAFMHTTYAQYYKHFGKDFGTCVPAIFTDEPSIHDAGNGTLPFSYWFAYEFKKRNGYDLIKNLPCVFANVEGNCFDYPPTKVRFDYYDTIHALWVKNSIEATGKWCEHHNINWTGHYLEHQWPHASYNVSPSIQSYYEYHQWPAIDMLMTSYLKDSPIDAITHTIRELKSAVNQFGKQRALCELYGAGGWDSTFDDYKRMADWVLVNGVNFINQHLTYATIMGIRKHDHPQSFDWREPWWNEYRTMNDYIGRASWMLTRGKMEQRILVLNPSTTGYLTEENKVAGSIFNSGGALDCISEPDMTEFLTLTQKLDDLQWDFDLGDEYTLARHADIKNGLLHVVCQQYSCVIVTGSMKNMLSSTVKLLQACASAGIVVLTVGVPGCYVDGVWEEDTYKALSLKWEIVSLEDIDKKLETIVPRRIFASKPFPAGFCHMRRRLENGETIWFFTNQAMKPYRETITLGGTSVKRLDLFTGEEHSVNCSIKDGMLNIPVELVHNQSLLLLVSDKAGKSSKQSLTVWESIPMYLCSIEQESENVYPIFYADYGTQKNVYVQNICDMIFRERGFPGNPWDNKVQFRRNIMDRDMDYDKQSGFSAAYHFTIEVGFIPKKIDAVAEHPEYCHLLVNGTDVPWNSDETYLDTHFGVADIARYVQPGENTAEIIVDVFHVLMELDAIYIKGAFSVTERAGKWVLTPPRPLCLGSWRTQGLPFYPYAVQYIYHVELDTLPQKADIDVQEYGATAVSLTINGQYAGLIHADGNRPADVTAYLKSGKNTVTIRVCGNFKNLFGPHFTQARGYAWPHLWRQYPEHTPKASAYDLLDFGLSKSPVMRIFAGDDVRVINITN